MGFTARIVSRVGKFGNARARYFLCVKKAYSAQWFQYIKRPFSSRSIIPISVPSTDAEIPDSTNKHHGLINSQTSLKQLLPPTTTEHIN